VVRNMLHTRMLAALAFRGEGKFQGKEEVAFTHKDLVVVQTDEAEEMTINAGDSQTLRVVSVNEE